MGKARLIFTLLALALASCHSPVQYLPPSEASDKGGQTGLKGLFAVNPGKQVCNESASQDTGPYAACMLFLNLGGVQNFSVDPLVSYDPATNTTAHDHLFIVDTSNTLRWCYEKPADVVELQDPEWSTHPDYVVFLGQDAGGTWDGYVVRISDHRVLKFCAGGGYLDEDATPHLYVGPIGGPPSGAQTALANGFASRDAIYGYFGTTDVKISFNRRVRGIQALYYINYNDSVPAAVRLPKPQGMERWNAESPLISENGKWVVYNVTDNGLYASYVQKLSPDSADAFAAILSENGGSPHFWKNSSDGSLYAVYCVPGGFNDADFTLAPDGSAGHTYMQELGLSESGPAAIRVRLINPPFIIADWPFKGGITRNGSFLATGYAYAYLYKLY
jgi:hypothetical protein